MDILKAQIITKKTSQDKDQDQNCNGRLQNLSYKWKGGHVVDKAVSCWPVTVEAQVQLQAYVRYVPRFFLEYFSLRLKVSLH
jgi:hypothetical protein